MLTTADVRLVMSRTRPGPNGSTVVCTEPPPDVAKAVSAIASASANGGNGTVTAGISGSAGTAEALAQLAGRSTALVGLRDGLYRACEAYANGAIGADAYALILSRYGQLMTSLFLGQDIVGAAGTASPTQISSPVINNLNAPGTSAQNTTSGSTAAPAAAASKTAAPSTTTTATTTSPATAPATTTTTTTTPTTSTPTSDEPKTAGSTQSTASPSTTATLALARMNQDYFNLSFDPVTLLVISCINANDPTRALTSGVTTTANSYLAARCSELTLDKINTVSAAAMAAFLPKLIDPTVGAAPAKAASDGGATSAPPSWTVPFKSGSSALDDSGIALVAVAAEAYKANPKNYGGILVTGETDSSGKPADNKALATARAATVVALLKALIGSTIAPTIATDTTKTPAAIIVLQPVAKGS